jgi:UDP-N-acetylglucosamine 2-epimerase (non-hydrolysing)
MRPVSIMLVVGARPNFMKAAPLLEELRRHPKTFQTKLIHTGQHYDAEMSDVFFQDLDLPRPDLFLGVGSGTHAEQTGKVMMAFEKVCVEKLPKLVVVVGDVNSTMACAIAAKKLCIPVAHVEAGLRSHDWTMPEEINRVVTDRVSDLLFTPSRDADENLLREGVQPDRIHFVGNVMIDCLLKQIPKTEGRDTLQQLDLDSGKYVSLTLHRPSNVDDPEVFRGLVDVMLELSRELPVIWPIHPRSRKMLEQFGLIQHLGNNRSFRLIPPMRYLDMLTLNRRARMIITDSGGLQEEATVLRVPCITIRQNTERPVTVEAGCNQVVGNKPAGVRSGIGSIMSRKERTIRIPELWDGKAALRIVDKLMTF